MIEDLATEALLDFINAVEAGCASAKQRIRETKLLEDKKEKPEWNPEKINWNKTEGSAGPYERSEDVNNSDFKEMLKDLATHNGKLYREGYFYWVFKSGSVVGRKARKK